MNIPLPKAGYWENMRLGRKVYEDPLPQLYTGQSEITLSLWEEGEKINGSLELKLNDKSKIGQDEINPAFVVSSKLTNPDPLIIQAKYSLTKKDAIHCRYEGMVTCMWDELDIRISPKNIGRALRFMDSFIKLLRTRKHDVKVEYGKTLAIVEGEKIKVAFHEKMKRIVVKKGNWECKELKPTGILSFKMSGYPDTEWTDGNLQIEQQLGRILIRLEEKVNGLNNKIRRQINFVREMRKRGVQNMNFTNNVRKRKKMY